jgi:Carboxypeptidase regulatory-like domain/TonB dependent receptor-like, beta-barrel
MGRGLERAALCGALVWAALPAAAQQTTGNINGRILDEQGTAVPGVTMTATHNATGFVRSGVSDEEGIYRLNALPVGTYDVVASLTGFSTVSKPGIVVNVGQTLDVNFDLKVAQVAENITVTTGTPLIETSSSAVGGVVDIGRIESLPLNGRQFANLAATVPGVGLGFHADPTKSTQYSPQIGGGNGRNVNYQIDGGDNNDDTVGGLLQLFPLEAIQEFNFVTSRYKAEYGRSNGGVMNIVTKSGSNQLSGTGFTLFRDDAMNARTETERLADAPKQDYRRYQFGGSVGGRIVENKAFFFGAIERTQQDTFQVVNTSGLFPEDDGPYATPYRENLLTGKVTLSPPGSHYVTVRYGRNSNTQPFGAAPQAPPSNWGESENEFNSFNVNHNWVLSSTILNEFVFQYADFANAITANSGDPTQTFPNGVAIGQNANTPQSTEQKKWQFRNDISWSLSRLGGLGHSFKAGVNYVHEPHLLASANNGTNDYAYTHLTNDLNGPLSLITRNGGLSEASTPLDLFSAYVQDDWRLTDRLTLNVGLRYDVVTGYQIDQSLNPNFTKTVAAARAGLLEGIPGLENFDEEPREDYDNFQPRLGVVYDVRGDGKDVIRGGWGVYYDVSYTNSSVLFPAFDANGIGFGRIFEVTNTAGIRNPDGSFYAIGQPISNIADQNQADPNQLPLIGQFLDPRIEQPYTRQASVGWSHELMSNTVVTVDYVRIDGRDLNIRPRLNTINPATGVRYLAFLNLVPNVATTRPAVSRGKSQYDGLILGLKRRMSAGVDVTATYTLSDSKSTIGTASDELSLDNIQDATNPFDAPVQFGPNRRTDARHRGTISAVLQLPFAITASPFFIFRSALPVNITEGVDRNRDGQLNDIPDRAYAFDGVGNAPKDLGPCETVNCGRGAKNTQFNLRVTKAFNLGRGLRLEAIGEVFNLFNAKNPDGFHPISGQNRRLVGGQANPTFLQPTAYAGDFQQGEQLVGQFGLRLTF